MTAKAALVKALLDGRVLNVKNCFTMIGLTNCAREISRMIEQPFGVEVSRTHMVGKSRYGSPVSWYDYRLVKTEFNKEGIERMYGYLKEQTSIQAEELPNLDDRFKEPTPKKKASSVDLKVIQEPLFQ